jgi:riboflavin biosynthesis pyrimidine reductase
VTLKIALDANGGAADLADIKLGRFTSPESLDMVHRLRGEHAEGRRRKT